MHVAETREAARAQVRRGLEEWFYYFREVAALPLAPTDGSDPVDALVDGGMAVIGTPDDAIRQIERLHQQSGGFGAYLVMDTNWAEWDNKRKSYELIARHVMPRFQDLSVNREASLRWAADNRPTFMGEARAAVGARVAQHIEQKSTADIRPENLEAMGLDKAKRPRDAAARLSTPINTKDGPMRAVVRRNKALVLSRAPDPTPGEGQVLARTLCRAQGARARPGDRRRLLPRPAEGRRAAGCRHGGRPRS